MNPTNQEEKLAVVMSSSPTNPTKVFEHGILITKLIEVQCSSSSNNQSSPPKPLLIFSPSEAGVFPVVLFLHGYLLNNSFYSQLLDLVASHGYIVVAPQLYLAAGPDASEEIKMASEISIWLSEGLSPLLPIGVKPNMAKLALAGHSRGGKVAFSVALNQTSSSSYPKFSALIGVDPVDGTTPLVLTYTPNSFNLNGTPVLIIGSGYGEERMNPFMPPCAPQGLNHKEFYNECTKPAYHFVADDYGHLDMLDDDTTGGIGTATYRMCKNGESRGPMRKFVGGIMVAFLEAYLGDDSRELVAISEGKANNVPLQMKSVHSGGFHYGSTRICVYRRGV